MEEFRNSTSKLERLIISAESGFTKDWNIKSTRNFKIILSFIIQKMFEKPLASCLLKKGNFIKT